jgi:CheY-like chemotaxis protein
MTGLRQILLAEDDAEDVELTLEALASHNLANAVVVVRDGAEALDYLHYQGQFRLRERGDPALVLLDIKMPKIDGLDVLRRIKTDPQLRTIPVVLLTSSREEQDLIRGYDLGANAYVVKPVDFAEFVAAIKTLGVFWALINEPPPRRDQP